MPLKGETRSSPSTNSVSSNSTGGAGLRRPDLIKVPAGAKGAGREAVDKARLNASTSSACSGSNWGARVPTGLGAAAATGGGRIGVVTAALGGAARGLD